MHKKFLLEALQQARLGQGHCAPNPSVGAVVVKEGVILAKAYHKGAGTPHAEPLVLAQIPKTPGLSLYVTLEPCNHWGRTPPCVDAIIEHGIEEVVFAFADPNPIVAKNNSSDILRAKGIKTTHLPLEEITEFYKSYAHWTLTHEPWVTVKIAQTLNGKIGLSQGKRVILSNTLCEQFTHKQRAITDVILTTAKTIQHDNPKMNVRLDSKVQSKPIAIIDPHLSLDKTSSIFATATHCHIFHCQSKDSQINPYPNSTLHWMPMCRKRMDLKAVFKELGALGYHNVWVEVGGTLFSALHEEGLVHRTYLYIVPKILEPQALSAYSNDDLFNKAHTISWQPMGDNMIACLDWFN